MEPLVIKQIKTDSKNKDICVFNGDICDLDTNIDILVLSSYKNQYAPVKGSIIKAIYDRFKISVELLAKRPTIDLRNCGGVWLSQYFKSNAPFKRIACVEIKSNPNQEIDFNLETNLFSKIKTLFQTLIIASINQISVETIAIPILGGKGQNLNLELVMTPLLNECTHFLKQCTNVKHIILFEQTPSKAFKMAQMLDNSYLLYSQSHQTNFVIKTKANDAPLVFISYSSKDYDLMFRLNTLLESSGMKTWFAPRDIILSSYASSIVEGIKNADFFLIMLSKDSMKSRHVLNELDLAFNEISDDEHLIPVKLDESVMNDAFRYYLSRLEWYQLKMHPNGTNLVALEDLIIKLKDNNNE